MIFNKNTILKTIADKIDSSVKDVFLDGENELASFEEDSIAKLVSDIPRYTKDEVTDKDVAKVVKSVKTESAIADMLHTWTQMESDISTHKESYSSIEDIVNGGYEEAFSGMSEKAGDTDKLEAEEHRLKKYAATAKGKKKASYEKKVEEIDEELEAHKESYSSIEDLVSRA
jgi:hypothetical protein